MLVKGLVFTALVASTPLAFVATQDPRPAPNASERASEQEQRLLAAQRLASQGAVQLAAAQRELDAARQELAQVRQQLDDALDQLDRSYEPQRERSCAPSRSRALMSHYQWLRGHGHGERAAGVIDRVVDQIGNDPRRLNAAAWSLMTDDGTTGKFDEVALAIAERMEGSERALEPNQLDTVALARFLNGQVGRAIALQQQAIERGGRGDDYRRRLRTYEAAQAALTKATVVPQPDRFMAKNDE